ncbi:hypothetical protein T552_01683 [Pneumocystis carinii B80]|uniref:PCI domain-containing protein n=1 Tax=Pneumocystis carinii (strain B80) TaxID=1408658 RepID=A0A0W4ZJ68_PNEC8|nr:hypothetical protein T552_01683 [Pneumocystis carinii B80]KTW28422.1 hypothetical protein T552_01683 [Pneumocystis carinii B80]
MYFEKVAYLGQDTCEPVCFFCFKLIQVKFLDKSEKFLETSKKYYELSSMECMSEIQWPEYSFSKLSELLDISVDMVQDYAAKIIEQSSISIKIDYISEHNEMILFGKYA